MTDPSDKHLKEIDSLKGVAILCVICIHAKFLEGAVVFDFGINRAVPIFLVLFGVTQAFSLGGGNSRPFLDRLRGYYRNRYGRLLVPFWATISAWWLGAVLITGVDPLHRALEILVSYLSFAPWMGTTWFVTLILQVVLVFPLLKWVFDRVGPFVVVPITGVLSALSVWYVFDIVEAGRSIYWDETIPAGFYYQWVFAPRVLFHLAVGLCLARFGGRLPKVATLTVSALLLLEPIAVGWARSGDPWTAPMVEQMILNGFDAPLTIALLGVLRWVKLPGAVERFLGWCGRSSWGLYLGHIFVFELVHLFAHAPELGSQAERGVYFLFLFASGAAITLAAASGRRRLSAVRERIVPERAATS